MTVSYFVLFQNTVGPEVRVSDSDREGISAILRRTPRLLKAHLYTPACVHGRFPDDGYAPQLALQLYFPDLPQLEAAIGPQGHLQALAGHDRFPSLIDCVVTQQAMLSRFFPTPSPSAQANPDEPRCSYLVHYPGHAEDLNAWLGYYLSHHPQLMRELPGIREIEVHTRLDWYDGMPWKRGHSMQRNKVVFDSPSALSAALDSRALHAMREDLRKFPPFAGGNIHYAMITSTIAGEPGTAMPSR